MSLAYRTEFQCSSASRKFLNGKFCAGHIIPPSVSVLFSEPKIPQLVCAVTVTRFPTSFSALQRAENSSMLRFRRTGRGCCGFSALQRAENSSIRTHNRPARETRSFQCSSASRKFLNRRPYTPAAPFRAVSVLFSEPKIPQSRAGRSQLRSFSWVSVLFSEPKIPQSRPSHLRPSIFPTATITLRRS